jgi:hypothetical protein
MIIAPKSAKTTTNVGTVAVIMEVSLLSPKVAAAGSKRDAGSFLQEWRVPLTRALSDRRAAYRVG